MSIIQFMQQEQEQQSGQVLDYISPSRLSLWMKCPLAFRRRYVEGFQTAPSPALFVGKITHSVLAHIYRLRQADQECTQDNLPMLLADAWKFGMETEPPFFENDAEEEKSRYQILDLVTAYLTAIPVQEEKPIAVEKRYEIPLIDLATADVAYASITRGTADTVAQRANARQASSGSIIPTLLLFFAFIGIGIIVARRFLFQRRRIGMWCVALLAVGVLFCCTGIADAASPVALAPVVKPLVGAVVGATYPEQLAELRRKFPKLFFLVPGYGAQGGGGASVAGAFDKNGMGAIINASRSMMCAWQKSPDLSFAEATRAEAIRMKNDIT